MKYSLVLLFVASLLPFQAVPSTGKILKESITSNGKNRSFYLFVPSTIASMTPAPLIVTLHGSGRNGKSLIEKWKDLAAKEGIILAGPDSINSAGWSAPEDGPDFLRDVIEAIKSKYPVNPRRVYLFGHSAGAGFAINISLLESEYFAATAVHAGVMEAETYWLIDIAKRKIPLTIFVGTNDPFFPLTKIRATRDALNARGFSVQVREIANHDHNYYDRATEINKSAWEFLKKEEISGDPRYEQHRYK